jgi:hypothetical protein
MEELRLRPKPGDLVCVVRTDDVLIKEGSCGVIEGEVGEIKPRYNVTFNPYTPWWDKGFVQASGGPVRLIEARDLRPTGRKEVQEFKLPVAGAAEIWKRTVDVWEVDLKKREYKLKEG